MIWDLGGLDTLSQPTTSCVSGCCGAYTQEGAGSRNHSSVGPELEHSREAFALLRLTWV